MLLCRCGKLCYRRPATDDEITAALTDDPNYGMTPPDGIFIVASAAGVVRPAFRFACRDGSTSRSICLFSHGAGSHLRVDDNYVDRPSGWYFDHASVLDGRRRGPSIHA